MKIYFNILLLILISFVLSEGSDCEKIKPSKGSDCVLSENDKKTYKYCCMQKLVGKYICQAFDEYDYIIQRAMYDEYPKMDLEYTFECNPNPNDSSDSSKSSNSSKYFSIYILSKIISFIFIFV